MLGYCFYHLDVCEVMDSIKMVKIFSGEKQIFTENGLIVVNKEGVFLCKKGLEIELEELAVEMNKSIQGETYLVYVKGKVNDFVKKD